DQVPGQRVQEFLVPRILGRQAALRPYPLDGQVPLPDRLVAERQDGYGVFAVVEPRQLAREVLDVHTRAAVHAGRVLARQDSDLQRALPPPRAYSAVPRLCAPSSLRATRAPPQPDAGTAIPRYRSP